MQACAGSRSNFPRTHWPHTVLRGTSGAHSFPRGPRGRPRNFREPPLGFLLQRAGNYGVPAVFPAFYWVSPLGPRERSRNFKISRAFPRPQGGNPVEGGEHGWDTVIPCPLKQKPKRRLAKIPRASPGPPWKRMSPRSPAEHCMGPVRPWEVGARPRTGLHIGRHLRRPTQRGRPRSEEER